MRDWFQFKLTLTSNPEFVCNIAKFYFRDNNIRYTTEPYAGMVYKKYRISPITYSTFNLGNLRRQ